MKFEVIEELGNSVLKFEVIEELRELYFEMLCYRGVWGVGETPF